MLSSLLSFCMEPSRQTCPWEPVHPEYALSSLWWMNHSPGADRPSPNPQYLFVNRNLPRSGDLRDVTS